MAFILPTRQVHLDFHTSPDISGVGSEFNPQTFADTVAGAHINSVCVFARCHHGLLYFQSEKYPERIHPHLVRPHLLNEQIDALHAHKIRAPLYVTIQVDHFTAKAHPEWLCRNEKGAILGTETFQPGFGKLMCVNTAYRDFLKGHIGELFDMMPVDGFFFDIVSPAPCACDICIARMVNQDLDPADASVRMAFGEASLNEFITDLSAFVRAYSVECSIFFNKGHIGPAQRSIRDAFSHFELESLPSGGWGYQHFPICMRYARTLGLSCVSHTGKFHTDWGDFHSFKNPEALDFECFRMIAMGCRCEIGDQMEPRGILSHPVYDLINSIYRRVEEKEPWCFPSQPVNDIAVMTPEAFEAPFSGIKLNDAIQGANQMLEELGQQFDIVDDQADLSSYKVLILPDEIPVNDALAKKIEDYITGGGRVLASFHSGLVPDGTRFALDFGVKYVGEAEAYRDFLMPNDRVGVDLPKTEHVMYLRGAMIENVDADVLGEVYGAWFDRTWRHFCSHKHAPSTGKPIYPGIVVKGPLLYFSHPIFSIYRLNAPRWCRSFVKDTLRLLLPQPVITHSGPVTMLTFFNKQPVYKRHVLHLLYYIPQRRSATIDIIDNVIPLYNIPIRVRFDCPVTSIRRVPGGESLEFTLDDNYVCFTVPEINGHEMIEIY